MYYVYILKNDHNRLYIGQTSNLATRIERHNAKRGADFTKKFGDFSMVYSESLPDQLSAMRREKQLKGWTRAKKEALINGDLKILKEL